MTQYNTLNVKFPDSQINKLKSGINNGTEIWTWNELWNFHEMLLVILMMRIIFHISFY